MIAQNEIVCDNEYIEVTPSSLVLPPRSERGFEVHYRPLIASDDETTCDLTIKNAVLGIYKYKLVLRGQQPNT